MESIGHIGEWPLEHTLLKTEPLSFLKLSKCFNLQLVTEFGVTLFNFLFINAYKVINEYAVCIVCGFVDTLFCLWNYENYILPLQWYSNLSLSLYKMSAKLTHKQNLKHFVFNKFPLTKLRRSITLKICECV